MIYFIIGLIIGAGAVYFLLPRKVAKESKKSAKETKDSNPAGEERKANIEKLEKFVGAKSTKIKSPMTRCKNC